MSDSGGMFCPECLENRELGIRFCGMCGTAVVSLDEAESRLRATLDARPERTKALVALEGLAKARGGARPAEIDRRALAWCAATRDQDGASPASDGWRRRLGTVNPGSLTAEEVAAMAGLIVHAADREANQASRRIWIGSFFDPRSEAVDRLGEELARIYRERAEQARTSGPADQVQPNLELATCAGGESSEVAALLKADRRARAGARARRLALAGAAVALLVIAVLVFNHFTHARVALVTTFLDPSDVVALRDDRGMPVELQMFEAGVLTGTTGAGARRLTVERGGNAIWDTTLMLAGGSSVRLEIPAPPAAALSPAETRAVLAARDPLRKFVNLKNGTGVSNDWQATVRAPLPTAAGPAGLIAYSNHARAPHAEWASAWFLVTPDRRLFRIRNLEGAMPAAYSANEGGRPAVLVTESAMNQGSGYTARTWIHHDGNSYRFRSVTTRFGEGVPGGTQDEPEASGSLTLELLPAELLRGIPSPADFPGLAEEATGDGEGVEESPEGARRLLQEDARPLEVVPEPTSSAPVVQFPDPTAPATGGFYSVPANSATRVRTIPLEAGVRYRFVVTGTFDAWGGPTHNIDAYGCFGGARCAGKQSKLAFELRIDGQGLDYWGGGELSARADHRYEFEVDGSGEPVTMYIRDAVERGSWRDNVGGLMVEIQRL